MKIKVNSTTLELTNYDDDISLLEKYSNGIDGTIPSFFKIISRSGTQIKVEDIRQALKDITPGKLSEPKFIEGTVAGYPGLSKKEIGYLWIMVNGIKVTKPDLYELQRLDRYGFITEKKVESEIKEFKASITKQRERIKKILSEEKRVFDTLEKIEPVATNDFLLEEVSSSILVSLPGGQSLLDIFDAMDATAQLPFIMVSYRGSTYYKINHTADSITPPVSWIEFTPIVDGIYFKVSNTKGVGASRALIKNIYSTGVWFVDNRIELTFITSFEDSESVVTKRIFDSLGGRVKYDIITTKQLGIKGTFSVPAFTFNKAIFADLITNNDTFKYFLFANERDSSRETSGVYKTLATRKRFYFYYSPNQTYNIASSLAMTITSDRGGVGSGSVVRIIRALNIQQAVSVTNVMAKLFGLYKNEREEIATIYSALLPSFKDESETKGTKAQRKDRKTGPRATALEAHDPNMFRPRYPDQCQREKQPYIIHTEQEAIKKAKELGDLHKIIQFGNVWYVCDPREPDDKNDRHTWPGLKLNTSDTGNKEFDTQYIREVPLFPCCYTQDQYKKKASQWRKYWESGGQFIAEAKEKEVGVGHIVKAANSAGYGRYGECPFNWEKLLKYLKIEKVIKGKQEIYPLLRKGVASSPDSFFHCVESALNPEAYNQIPSAEEQRKYIMKIREKIARTMFPDRLNIGGQELYGMSVEEIRSALLNEAEYMAPEKYVSIAQAYYKCNIFMYIVDDLHPNGEILLPRSAEVYLPRDMDEHLRTILIVKYEAKGEVPLPDYPYQCELMVLVDVRDKKFDKILTNFENHPVSRLAMKLYYDANDIFIVSPEGYDIYRPVPEGM